MKEKPKHLDAFRYFFTLTEKGHEVTDAIPLTAEHCGVKPRTVWRWYKEFNWEIRSVEKRAKIQEEVERKENQTLIQGIQDTAKQGAETIIKVWESKNHPTIKRGYYD